MHVIADKGHFEIRHVNPEKGGEFEIFPLTKSSNSDEMVPGPRWAEVWLIPSTPYPQYGTAMPGHRNEYFRTFYEACEWAMDQYPG